MSFKISKADNDYSFVDINSLVKNLEEAEKEDWTMEDVEKETFSKLGTIPSRIAKASVNSFGLRHAYFDIWHPVNPETKGVWKLNKEADGTEWIVREDDNEIKFS